MYCIFNRISILDQTKNCITHLYIEFSCTFYSTFSIQSSLTARNIFRQGNKNVTWAMQQNTRYYFLYKFETDKQIKVDSFLSRVR